MTIALWVMVGVIALLVAALWVSIAGYISVAKFLWTELQSSRSERRELYTRIQAWDAPRPEPLPQGWPTGGTPTRSLFMPALPDEEAMARQYNFKPNPDGEGGWIDIFTGDLYEDLPKAIEWRQRATRSGIPLSQALEEMSLQEKFYDEGKLVP